LADELELCLDTPSQAFSTEDLARVTTALAVLRIKEDLCRELLSQLVAAELPASTVLDLAWTSCYLAEEEHLTSLLSRRIEVAGYDQPKLKSLVSHLHLLKIHVHESLKDTLELLKTPSKPTKPKKALDSVASVLSSTGVSVLSKILHDLEIPHDKKFYGASRLCGISIPRKTADQPSRLDVIVLGAEESLAPTGDRVSAIVALTHRQLLVSDHQVVILSNKDLLGAVNSGQTQAFLKERLGRVIQ
jgi:hypothetical protein